MTPPTPETPRALLRGQDGLYFDCPYCGEVQRVDVDRRVFIHADNCPLLDVVLRLAEAEKFNKRCDLVLGDLIEISGGTIRYEKDEPLAKEAHALWDDLHAYHAALASNESPPQGFGWRDGKLYADDGSVMYPKETPREHAARDHGQHEIPMIAHWCGRPVTGLSKAELVAALNMMAAEVEAMRSRHKGELDFALNLGTQERARR